MGGLELKMFDFTCLYNVRITSHPGRDRGLPCRSTFSRNGVLLSFRITVNFNTLKATLKEVRCLEVSVLQR